jgi:hypothetical protein
MTERVMSINAVQPFLTNFFSTETVKVRETNRVITIEPAEGRKFNCPLLGAAVGSKLTVERFLEMTREDKESQNKSA